MDLVRHCSVAVGHTTARVLVPDALADSTAGKPVPFESPPEYSSTVGGPSPSKKTSIGPVFLVPAALETLVGSGAYGAVYKARWGGQQVAAKTLFPSQSDLHEKAIQKEISVLQRLRHRHIIQFYRTHEQGGRTYLIMDFAEKGSLASVINTKSGGGGQDLSLDWPTKMRLAHEMARGLEYIHHEGVLHCDLKSANVLLTPYMEVKLADFGLAQVWQSMSTSASMSNSSAEGTLRWMAPELFSDKPKYSSKSDMYALGMVMWEMAANCTRPFQDQPNDYVVPTFVKNGGREILPNDTPAQYRELVEQFWRQDPAQRPNASEVVLLVHDEPTEEGGAVDEDCSAISFSSSTDGSMLGQGQGHDDVEGMLHNLAIAENQKPGYVGRLPQTDDLVVSFFSMQAQQGDVDAQLFLGWMYSHGRDGVDKSVEDSLCWYRQAAKRGNATAQLALARIYEQGQGVEPSDVEAVTWYRKAADRGNAEAQFSLGRLYDHGRGVKEDNANAARWYRRAADQGQVDAQIKMGSWCSLGLGVEQSDVEAANWYRKAALQGNATGQLNFGYMYHVGQGLEKDNVKAVAWYRKAAEQGGADAQLNLGVMYYHGNGVEQSHAQATALYRQAAEQGNLKAQLCLSTMYEGGLGVEQDYVEAISWLRRAAEQGHHEAQHYFAGMYVMGLGVEQNYVEAVFWLLKAALQGNAAAQSQLGSMYASGAGVKQSDIVAVRWYKKAVAQGDVLAMFNLGCFYNHGRGVEQSYVAALAWHRMATDHGDEMSPRNIGHMYEVGQVVEQSIVEAVKWYLVAAERGDVRAQILVSKAFFDGRGVKKNMAEASKWRRKAAEQIDVGAQL
ncbi:hypothetical protein BG011_010259 [Mortierella polycephala]|uniref:Protein kinase domain-containing protein n=1 Tax=Mortierella polycephala TaxID=41804 RepID=A0A9P6PMY0_9FUNG|nr:hypothetical protein BG011_010259 [Mortierella polycephala]